MRTPMLLLYTLILVAPAIAEERPPALERVTPTPAETIVRDDDVARTPRADAAGARNLNDPRDGLSESERAAMESRWLERAGAKTLLPEIGGDDITVRAFNEVLTPEVAVTPDGIIFVACGNYASAPSYDEFVTVYRSTDGGEIFTPWGQFGGPGLGIYRLRDLDATGGTTPRVFVTYMRDGFVVDVAFADPNAATPTWTVRTPLSAGASFLNPDLDTDADSYDSYYLYLVSSGLDGNGDDIWFTRSTDQGNTWSAPYRIGELSTNGNLMYAWPRVSYGYGGVIHVVWTYTERLQNTFDDAIRYRRAVNFAGTAADWQPGPVGITSTADGVDQVSLDIEASLTDPTVLLAHSTAFASWLNPKLRASTDGGATWPAASGLDLPFDSGADLEFEATSSRFMALGILNGELALTHAGLATPLSWSAPETFSDAPGSYLFWPDLAIDASRGHRVAGVVTADSPGQRIVFDAEWRADPGYPNLEPGFPLALASQPISPPALVNLDQDDDLEIVFSDAGGNVQVLNPDGTSVPGWPVHIGPLSDGPVAVGELDFSGPTVVVGTADGYVHAFTAAGVERPGWPRYISTAGPVPVYVSIGALGGPYPHVVAVAAGAYLYTLNVHNESAFPFSRSWPGRTITAPVAFGDIDGDGLAEYVGAASDLLFALPPTSRPGGFVRSMPALVSDAPTLADFDADGDAEIVVPLANGKLYVMQGNGVDMPGWPFTTPSGTALTSAAIAQILGNATPELAVAARNWTAHVLYANGAQQSGYPVYTGSGWYSFGAPIMGRVQGPSPDVVLASRDAKAWAWDNFGAIIPGWPKTLTASNQVELSPAMGDIDQDGRNEIVFLGNSELVIVDVGEAPHSAASTWGMYGHDPQRTGCANCVEDVVTAVGPDPEGTGTTRVSFAGASPNPLQGPGAFRFSVPVRARAELEVFDLRGYRVRTVLRAEVPAGDHVATWDGRDAGGRDLASGRYFARLRVQGPGVEQELVRGVTVLR